MVKIALCDDCEEELTALVSIMNEYKQTIYHDIEYSLFHNGFELLTALEKHETFDIYCLDILMPNFNGIELGKEIRNQDKKALILYLTSSPEFALQSYSVKANNYILKPISNENLFGALNDALELLDKEKNACIVVRDESGLQKIFISNLIYVEVIGRKVFYHLTTGRTIECHSPFGNVCDNLCKYSCFVKTHRSYLVNMCFIDRINTIDILLQNKIAIPIAQGKTKEIKDTYLAFQMED